jgi:hypothetical protein
VWEIERERDMEKVITLKKLFRCVCSQKVVSGKLLSKLSCVCLSLEKLVNRKHFQVNWKHFPVKEKYGLISKKMFSFYFWWKALSGSCEKFRNVILFADYIKFGPQTFDCYWIFIFLFYLLEFNFYINFGLRFQQTNKAIFFSFPLPRR